MATNPGDALDAAAALTAESVTEKVSEIDPPEVQGDPVCWLHRVCQNCGALADEERPTVCLRCGSTEFGE